MSQSFARHTRRAAIAKGRRHSTYLDNYNEFLAEEHSVIIHPTRGYRKVNPKRTAAQTIINMTRQGFGGTTAEMREALQSV